MNPALEHTGGRTAGRRALHESRRASVETDSLITEVQDLIETIRATREANHFADKFRAIIKG